MESPGYRRLDAPGDCAITMPLAPPPMPLVPSSLPLAPSSMPLVPSSLPLVPSSSGLTRGSAAVARKHATARSAKPRHRHLWPGRRRTLGPGPRMTPTSSSGPRIDVLRTPCGRMPAVETLAGWRCSNRPSGPPASQGREQRAIGLPARSSSSGPSIDVLRTPCGRMPAVATWTRWLCSNGPSGPPASQGRERRAIGLPARSSSSGLTRVSAAVARKHATARSAKPRHRHLWPGRRRILGSGPRMTPTLLGGPSIDVLRTP